MDFVKARQMIWQRLARGFILCAFGFGRECGGCLGGGGLDILQRQFELLDRALDLFRRGAKTRPAQRRKFAFSFSISVSRE